MYRVLLYLYLFVSFTISVDASARSIINSVDCIIGNQVSSTPLVKVSPIGQKCYNTCQQYCAQKFKVDVASFSKNSVSDKKDALLLMKTNVISANQDRIESCLQECFKSRVSTNKIRVPKTIDPATGMILDDFGNTPYPWTCDIYSEATDISELSCEKASTHSNDPSVGVCSQGDMAHAYFDGGVRVVDGSKILVKLADSINTVDTNTYDDLTHIDGNNLYLCGFRTTIYSPTYIYESNYISGDTGIGLFNPRAHGESNALGTGIFVKNDDLLSINYLGRYYSRCPGPNCTQNNEDFKLGLNTSSAWQLAVPSRSINDQTDEMRRQAAQVCEPCIRNRSLSICSTAQCQNQRYTATVNGLDGYVSWISNPKLFATKLNYDDAESQFRSTSLHGNVKLTGTANELKIYYPQSQSTSNGGYFVTLAWRGCRYQNGERLQYIIINDAILNSDFYSIYMNDDSNWRSLNMQNVDGVFSAIINVSSGNLSIPSIFDNDGAVSAANNNQGKIFFRINPLSKDEALNLGAQLYGRENALGQYYLKVEPSATKMIPSKIIDIFYKILKDVAGSIFKGFQKSQDYLNVVRLILVLYVAMTGLMFMTGMANITQNEAIIRVFKIAVVVMLLSPNSAAFFNDSLFKIFSFDTMNHLANLFTPEIEINLAKDLTNNVDSCFHNSEVKVSLICVLENDFKMLFAETFWLRILGLLISGLFLPAVAIVAGVFMYGIIVLKVTFMFCIAMLALTVTISLAPLFIPMILFKYTKTFFDSWIKQLMSTTLQPVFIFTSISLFRAMFLTLMQAAIGVVSCKVCWLEFSLPFGSYCLFNIYPYVSVSLGSAPDAFSLPLTNIWIFISMFFIGHAMYTFCDFASKMAANLINFSSFDIGSTGVGPDKMLSDFKAFAKPVYEVATAPLDILAIDDESRKTRKEARKQRRDDQNAGKKN